MGERWCVFRLLYMKLNKFTITASPNYSTLVNYVRKREDGEAAGVVFFLAKTEQTSCQS